MPRSWGRRADEPPDAFLAFLAYCQAPPAMRSLDLVAAVLNPDGSEWRPRHVPAAWARRFRWKERAAAWDADRSPKSEMTGRHLKEALALQQKLLERLRKLDADDLKPAEIIRWFDVSVRVEKEAHEADQDNDE